MEVCKKARSSETDKPYQMSVDANKQVFLGGTAKGVNFNNDLVVGPQISGDTSPVWKYNWMVQLILEIGYGQK